MTTPVNFKALTTDPADSEIPPILGKYVIERLIGVGSFATVFGAAHAHIPALKVAIKVLRHEHVYNETIRRRFEREAQAAALLRDPHTVKVLDFGVTEDARPYLVMEYIEGVTLEELIKKHGTLHSLDTSRFTLNILQALEEAHRVGIIHRDLKPANVFITRTRTDVHAVAKVLDFGIAKIVESSIADDGNQTTEGLMLCTPAYGAREVLLGLPEAKSDLYAMGMLMAEMLDGVAPYANLGSNSKILAAQLDTDPVPLGPNASRGPLTNIIRRALEKDPNDRWADAVEMATAILQIQSSLTGPLGGVDVPSANSIVASSISRIRTTPTPLDYQGMHARGTPTDVSGAPKPVLAALVAVNQTQATPPDAPPADVIDHEHEESRKGIPVLHLIAAAAAIAAIVALLVMQPWNSDSSTPSDSSETASLTDGDEPGTDSVTGTPAVNPNTMASLQSNQASVTAYIDGQRLGVLPIDGAVLPPNRPVEIVFSSPGYESSTVVVTEPGPFEAAITLVVATPALATDTLGQAEPEEGSAVSPPVPDSVDPPAETDRVADRRPSRDRDEDERDEDERDEDRPTDSGARGEDNGAAGDPAEGSGEASVPTGEETPSVGEEPSGEEPTGDENQPVDIRGHDIRNPYGL